MSHLTVLIVSQDPDGVMNAMGDSHWDYYDVDNTAGRGIGGVPIQRFRLLGDLRLAWEKCRKDVLDEIGAVIENGIYDEAVNAERIQSVIDRHTDAMPIRLYDVHE